MSSVVCQGQRSCLKPRLIEPIVLRHRLSPPISIAIPVPEANHIQEEEEEDNKVTKNDDMGGWTFLNALANPTQFRKQVYVHPTAKSFSSSLSSKSLEMCTEGLGCETGSDICENNDEFSAISWEKERLLAMRRKSKLGSQLGRKVVPAASSSSFPPPLTSISGSDGVRVRPHREGGRLVIKAVSVSSCGTNFQAERTNGRLTLSLVKDCSMKCQFEMAAEVEDTKIDDEEEEEAKYNDEEKDMKIEVEVDEEDDEETHEEEEDGDFVGDMGGNGGKAGGGNGNTNGNGEFPRPSRCKEGRSGNKGLSDWRSFWVAIS